MYLSLLSRSSSSFEQSQLLLVDRAQVIHDEGTLDNKMKLIAIGINFTMPDFTSTSPFRCRFLRWAPANSTTRRRRVV